MAHHPLGPSRADRSSSLSECPAVGSTRLTWGAVAQLVERRLCKADVGGSSPPGSTKSRDPTPSCYPRCAQARSDIQGPAAAARPPRNLGWSYICCGASASSELPSGHAASGHLHNRILREFDSFRFLKVTLRIAECGALCPGGPPQICRSQSVLDGGSSY